MSLPTIPPIATPDPAGDYARAQAWAMLLAKNQDAGNWATWAATIMTADITDINNKLGSNTVDADLAALSAEIDAIADFIPGTITGGDGVFSDSLLTKIKARLESDIQTYSTGLGATVEAAMFARETARVNATRAAAYNEITTAFSSRGFDMPPGALLAKQTEVNNETSLRLTDSSGKILEETTRLALDYNKFVVTASTQLVEALARVFESQEMRAFEASKTTVLMSVEGYKTTLGMVTAKADIVLKEAQLALEAKARQLALEVTTLQGLSQSAMQIVASALNGVHSSTSFGFSGSASTSYQGT